MKKWKILKEVDVSPSKWFPIVRHEVELPNGKIVDDYYLSPMSDVVMIFPLTKENDIILVRQYKHGLGELVIELPAGYRQEDKTLEQSAAAELEEEVGIKTDINNLLLVGKLANNPTKIKNITYCYFAKDLEFNSTQKLDENEEIEILKVKPKEVMDMIKRGEIWMSDTVANIMRVSFLYPEIFQ